MLESLAPSGWMHIENPLASFPARKTAKSYINNFLSIRKMMSFNFAIWQLSQNGVFVMRVPGQGLEQRESGKTVLYPQIIIIGISYIILYYHIIN